ncbi:alpha/beta hydrolase [Agrobacterium sp. P15N1-A]|uniref:alpha/beta hydrolase n=1 Tax=Agrobacterium sp. P15N1-A TaxID=3342820 RepID=UPI0037D87DA6
MLLTITLGFLTAVGPAHADKGCKESTPITVPLPDPVSGRRYEIYVSLPAGYAEVPTRSYPLVILADGGRAFPRLSCAARAVSRDSARDEPIVVGLSYAAGEDLEDSRRRDYTPTKLRNSAKAYGGAAAYQTYLANVVLPYVEGHYRVSGGRRIFWGHSYGGLLGAHILLTAPSTFQTYILGSPSFWFDDGAIMDFETRYANRHRKLEANVILYVGGLEISRYDPQRKGKTRDMVQGLNAFETRLASRNYAGLRLTSKVIAGTDHRSSVGPGFAWGLNAAFQ